MVLGMSIPTFTLVHVLASLLGIASGFIVLFGMLRGEGLSAWTAIFLSSTILTSASGFMFHSTAFGPAHVLSVMSLLVSAVAVTALYAYRLQGVWRGLYVAGAVSALYFNVFTGIVQAFEKLKPLHALAPTQSEAPFLIVQAIAAGFFLVFGILAARIFRRAAAKSPFARLA